MTQTHDTAVCIGRFQLLHNAQLALIRRALELAPKCVVVIGSAHQARSPKNPFTWQERADMVRLALAENERARTVFVPVRDFYDQERWVQAVRKEVVQAAGGDQARVVLVGHRKDPTSEYLNNFPAWELDDPGLQGDLHAKALRAALFATPSMPAALAAIAGQVPPSTVEFLRAWTQLPFFEQLRDGWQQLAAEHDRWADSPYPPVFVTVDALVRMGDHVLLIRRGRAPGRGLLALPGGFIEQRETVYQSALRELAEETGLRLLPSEMATALKEVRVFDHPDRSQRGRVITHAHYFAFGARMLPEIIGSDDAADAMWVPIAQLTSLEDQFHDDHFHMLDAFLGLT
ncbi:MAG TPA: bifunctional nicotinamide-nucleotide adenylyltransferase/Nudix hydroxylase [Ramlibacter sp.]|jgi:bifunctional NMN adenylyltransferase/nudix hydrolase|uniref:bifunctional nicotinamide-nucleotide adenylyltransferase/Nudix hydroxylase n=1 Tax=Ramlibacter sp. TaxID=1917967 RepID=UPI002D673C7E|nr:bifunctional nicotinamide-nucleotide adenylyltransferase/Nudix hydroxylase [Ramlibacter sp.]HZY20744.1 bifunctional nicotinamide-nucleotide adenylyltransferase/Nudix hydroxylase [Ramlibacter sp.]